MIYLDNSATTPISDEVRAAMQPFLDEEFGNASSVYTLGTRARVALEEAREVIARSIGAEPREIIFTSSGTEANNAAIKGPLFQKYFQGVSWDAMSIVTNAAEHHAVLHPVEFLSKLGVVVRKAEVDSAGRVSAESISDKLDPTVALVTTMLVNNEIGTINPVKEISERAKRASAALVHTDAVQAIGKMPVNVRDLGVDLLSMSAHKLHGPKGIGALYVKSGVEWEPLLHGGAQERNRRGGTESVALAVGFAEAVRQAETARETSAERIRETKCYLLSQLQQLPEVVLNTPSGDAIHSITNFSFNQETLKRLDADALLIRFDLEGIAISNGSACTSGSLQPSHVLLAMGKGDEVARKSLRVSLSRYNTKSDIDEFIAALLRIIR